MLPLDGCLGNVGESVEEVYVGSKVLIVILLPDPKKVVAGVRSGDMLLLDVGSAEIVRRYVGHIDSVSSATVSGDGR